MRRPRGCRSSRGTPLHVVPPGAVRAPPRARPGRVPASNALRGTSSSRTHDRVRGTGDQPHEVVDLRGRCCRDLGGELGSRANAELAIDLREVPRDRVRAQAELRGNLAVLAAGYDQLDDLALRLGEPAVGCCASPDSAQLGARFFRPEACAESFEDRQAAFERLPSRTLLLSPALRGPQQLERACQLKRIHLLRRIWLDGRSLERGDCTFLVASRGVEKSTRAMP